MPQLPRAQHRDSHTFSPQLALLPCPALQKLLPANLQNSLTSSVQWSRPGEFCRRGLAGCTVTGSAYLFKDDMVASDVIQGRLKDCWLLGAFSIVAAKARALQERVLFAWVEWGLYAVQYFLDGRWVTVIGAWPFFLTSSDPHSPSSGSRVGGATWESRCR